MHFDKIFHNSTITSHQWSFQNRDASRLKKQLTLSKIKICIQIKKRYKIAGMHCDDAGGLLTSLLFTTRHSNHHDKLQNNEQKYGNWQVKARPLLHNHWHSAPLSHSSTEAKKVSNNQVAIIQLVRVSLVMEFFQWKRFGQK